MSFYFQEVAGQARNDSLTGNPACETNAQTTVPPLAAEWNRGLRGNLHNAAGVKNKKLFERSELFFV
ncbi:MAG: hypothetical protein LBK03_06600 [Bacteroidales bacterium]|jgi:hypothetical protein|nr:hypothetical protein [Bacteroidales bacterium]